MAVYITYIFRIFHRYPWDRYQNLWMLKSHIYKDAQLVEYKDAKPVWIRKADFIFLVCIRSKFLTCLSYISEVPVICRQT